MVESGRDISPVIDHLFINHRSIVTTSIYLPQTQQFGKFSRHQLCDSELGHHREPPTVAIGLGGTTVGQPLLGRCRAAGFMRKSSAINASYSNKYQNYLVYIYVCIYILYLVGGLKHEFYFSIYWKFHHPN